MNFLIIITAQYVFFVSIAIYLLYLGYLWIRQRKKFISFLILSFISFPSSLIVAKILSRFIYNPRPFVVEHIKPLFAHAADNGFPSDHMLLTMTVASAVFIYNKKLGIVLTFIAICIGTARVLASVHHVEDILASSVVAIGITYLVYLLIRTRSVSRWLAKVTKS